MFLKVLDLEHAAEQELRAAREALIAYVRSNSARLDKKGRKNLV